MELTTIAQKTLKDHQRLYIGFVDFEKAFDRVNHVKMTDMLGKIGIDDTDLKIIKTLYKEQKAAFKINGKMTDWFKINCGVRQGCLWSPSFFNLYSEEIIIKALEDVEGIKIGGNNFNRIRYADDVAILTKSREELKKALERIQTVGSEYGMKMNISKTKVMIISEEENIDCKIMINQKIIEQVKEYRYLGNLITEDGRSKKEIKTRIGMAKTAFWNHRELLRNDVNKSLKIRMLKCYVWSVFLYGCETWTLTKEYEKRIDAFDMWCARRMLKIKWTDKIRNEEVWERIGSKYSLLEEIVARKWKYAGHVLRGSAGPRIITALEGWTKREKRPGRPRKEWLDDLKAWSETRNYSELKRKSQNRNYWRSMRANLRIGERT